MMKKNKGFTLVELLAVLIVLSMIALIAVPSITKVIRRQQQNIFKVNVQSIVKASKTDWYNSERSTGFYTYTSGNLSYHLNDAATAEKVSTEGKVINGSGKVTINSVDDDDIFSIVIHDDDWCGKYKSTDEDVIVTEYEGVCE